MRLTDDQRHTIYFFPIYTCNFHTLEYQCYKGLLFIHVYTYILLIGFVSFFVRGTAEHRLCIKSQSW